jgi:Cof subfamily protein (haloacid dehalogenase superfamily)
MSFRLLALDLDGTLLDPDGRLGAAAHRAVSAARAAGLEVVLCTGRRFRTALPLLRELEMTGSVVVNNGAVVKDVASGKTLYRAALPPEVFRDALGLLREVGPPLVYVDTFELETDFFTEAGSTPHEFQREYLDDHGATCAFVPDLRAAEAHGVIMLSLMADAATLAPVRARTLAGLGERITTHLIANKNYRGSILEVLSRESGKWNAVARLARERGIRPEQIAAVGDDGNDAELLRRAGLGIAMGNAVDEAKAAADLVVGTNAEGGVAQAVARVLGATAI